MDWGLNIQLKSVPNPAYTAEAVKQAKAAGKDPPAKTISQAQFCFDPAFARRDLVGIVQNLPDRCGAAALQKKGTTVNEQNLTVIFKNRNRQSVGQTFTIIMHAIFRVFLFRTYPSCL